MIDSDTLGQRYRRWVPRVMLVTALANVALVPFLPIRAQPVRYRGTPELRHLVFSERSSVDIRFGFYEDLRSAIDGGTLVVPPGSIVFAYIARALSDVTVKVVDYDPFANDFELPEPRFSGTHDGTGEEVEYMVLPGEDDLWWLGISHGVVVIISESMIPVPEPAGG